MAEVTDPVAKHYAKALLEVTAESGGEKAAGAMASRLEEFAALGEGGSGDFFENPTFTREEKLRVLRKLEEGKRVEPALSRFLELVVSLGHVSLLRAIAGGYAQALRERRNEVKVRVRTAYPLSRPEEERLAAGLSRVTRKKVLLDVAVDRELIGGVTAEVGGVLYDATIRSYLTRLTQETEQ